MDLCNPGVYSAPLAKTLNVKPSLSLASCDLDGSFESNSAKSIVALT